jgi:hypothetical protein
VPVPRLDVRGSPGLASNHSQRGIAPLPPRPLRRPNRRFLAHVWRTCRIPVALGYHSRASAALASCASALTSGSAIRACCAVRASSAPKPLGATSPAVTRPDRRAGGAERAVRRPAGAAVATTQQGRGAWPPPGPRRGGCGAAGRLPGARDPRPGTWCWPSMSRGADRANACSD